ncbi:MAG TPA: AMP-binding protein, partial [Vicinamibacterales bacterium]|nr:AMP-binding protein [Vicinamibacterales bacterium]
MDFRPQALAGRSVLVATRDPAAAAIALIELDGVARRLIVCTPDVGDDALADLAQRANADAIVDEPSIVGPSPVGELRSHRATEWVLLTSGTSGKPKLVVHTFATLTGAISPPAQPALPAQHIVWGTFYDIRRYGGLQILLRAFLGRVPIVLRGPDESIGDYLARLSARGVTHVSGTPSHWRRALMSPQARTIAPRYVRLSGEIADQGILSALRAFFPDARVGHAFATTEAGVGFEVDAGREGFPASIVAAPGSPTAARGAKVGDV